MKLETVKLTEVRKATPSVLFARLEGGDPAIFEAHRLPGQTVRLKAGKAEAEIHLASQPAQRHFELLVEKGTEIAEELVRLDPGADLQVSAPFGDGFPAFEYRGHDLYLVGHGAGLGTVRSAVLYVLTERDAFGKVELLAEARFVDEIPFHDEFSAFQRAGVRVFQVIARADSGKWKKGEQAYVHDLLADLGLNASQSAVLACGPDDMLKGVQGVLREARVPPEKVHLFRIETAHVERSAEPERTRELLEKLSSEGLHGSGHQADAGDHSPSFELPSAQPRGTARAPYPRR